MKKYIMIKNVIAREIIDSRGNPTVEVEVTLEDDSIGRVSIPSGTSTGSYEAFELRDNDNTRYMGKGVQKAVNNIKNIITPNIIGMNGFEQNKLDKMLIELDGTNNKINLGANAILGVSLANAKACANSLKYPFFRYIGGINSNIMPIPMMNILNGGKHATSNMSIQEFMIMPVGAQTFSKAMQMCIEVYNSLKRLLLKKNKSISVGDEGGFAPDLNNDEEGLKLIEEAIDESNYKLKDDFMVSLDIAANEMYAEATKIGKIGDYYFWKTGILKTRDEMIEYLEKLVNDYHIISIEDGLAEEDYEGWKLLNQRLGNKVQLVGDDLFTTNINRLNVGIKEKFANSILIKPNQIGSLTEVLDVVELAKNSGFNSIISHRSGETEDTIISDLAVALNVGQIKAGAPCRTDRVAKYNQLLRIEEELGENAIYLGNKAFEKLI